MLSTTKSFTFIAPLSFKDSSTRMYVRLLGPCFKTGRMGNRPTHCQPKARIPQNNSRPDSHHSSRVRTEAQDRNLERQTVRPATGRAERASVKYIGPRFSSWPNERCSAVSVTPRRVPRRARHGYRTTRTRPPSTAKASLPEPDRLQCALRAGLNSENAPSHRPTKNNQRHTTQTLRSCRDAAGNSASKLS